MKYMLLIHQGTTPLPGSEEWGRLSQEKQNEVYAAYKALNETPGFSPGLQMQPPETTVRVQDGKTLTTAVPFVEMKEAVGGYCFFEADDLDAAIELASRIPAATWVARSRCARSWSGSDPRAGIPRAVGSGSRCDGRLPRRL